MMDKKQLGSAKRMKVLFLQSQTYFGADSRIHALLMKHLDRSCVDVHVALNYGDADQKSASAAAVEEIPDLSIRATSFGASIYGHSRPQIVREAIEHGLPAFASLSGLHRYIRTNKIQIIHCTEKPRDAFLGFLLARLSGAKCLIHVHVKAENWIDPKVQWAMRHADALVGVSRFVAESIVEMGFPEEKTHYIHNSIELDGWDSNVNGSRIREEFQIGPGVPLMLIVSRLFYWKGHSELLQALALVKRTIPKFRLLIVGDDDPRAHPGRGSYTAELQAIVKKFELSDHVLFMGYRSDIPELMAACDIYTMPSFEEPFGMVFLEAMAMKKPVIALDNGGSREIIQHDVTGLLSKPKDVDHLVANISTLIENPCLRTQMGERGRKLVEERFTPAHMSSEFLNLYQRLLLSGNSQSFPEYSEG